MPARISPDLLASCISSKCSLAVTVVEMLLGVAVVEIDLSRLQQKVKRQRSPFRLHRAGEPDVRILVVEDDHKVASFIQSGLAQEGYAVDVLHDGSGAGEQARAVDYDAVVLDLMLPAVPASGAARHPRAQGRGAVLILTARTRSTRGSPDARQRGRRLVGKPSLSPELSARPSRSSARHRPTKTTLQSAIFRSTQRHAIEGTAAKPSISSEEYAASAGAWCAGRSSE